MDGSSLDYQLITCEMNPPTPMASRPLLCVMHGPGPSYYSDLCRRTAVLHSGSKGLDQIDSDLARVFPPSLPLADEGCEWCRSQEGQGQGRGEEEACGKGRPLDEGEQSDAQTENSEEDPLSADEEGAVDFRVCEGQEGEMDPHYYISDAALDEGIEEIQLGLYREEGVGEKDRGLQVEEGNVAQVLSRMLHALDGQARGHKMAQHSQGPSCYVQVGGALGKLASGLGKRKGGGRVGGIPGALVTRGKLDSSIINQVSRP